MGQNATFQCIAGGKWSQHDKLWLQVRMREDSVTSALVREESVCSGEGLGG